MSELLTNKLLVGKTFKNLCKTTNNALSVLNLDIQYFLSQQSLGTQTGGTVWKYTWLHCWFKQVIIFFQKLILNSYILHHDYSKLKRMLN